MALISLNKSDLQIGDIVGIPIATVLGWTHFRYHEVVPKTIARITPARTKFIMDDGSEYNHRFDFVAVNDETEARNEVVKAVKTISASLSRIDQCKSRGELYTKDDRILMQLSQLLSQSADLLYPKED